MATSNSFSNVNSSLSNNTADQSIFNQIVADKDALIAQLQKQITDLSSQVSDLTSQLGELTRAIGNSNQKNHQLSQKLQSISGKRSSSAAADNHTTPKAKFTRVQPNPKPSTSTANQNSDDDNVDMQNVSNSSFAAVTAKKTLKCMPIQLDVFSIDDASSIQAILADKFPDQFQWIQNQANSPAKIYPVSVDVKNQITELLASNNVQFNSYADKSTQKHSFILRGLNLGVPSNNISSIGAALLEAGATGSLCVEQFMTGYMKRHRDETNSMLYRVTSDVSSDIPIILSLKNIGCFRIRMEKMHKSTVVQCKRCQRFQHSATSCSFDYRCVQCAAVHLPGQCPRVSNKKLPLQCVNCIAAGFKNTAHTANNLNACAFFKDKHPLLFNKHQIAQSVTAKHVSDRSSNNSTIKNSNSRTSAVGSNNIIHPTAANGVKVIKRTKNNRLINQYRQSISNQVNNTGKPGKSGSISPAFNSSKFNEFAQLLFESMQRVFNAD